MNINPADLDDNTMAFFAEILMNHDQNVLAAMVENMCTTLDLTSPEGCYVVFDVNRSGGCYGLTTAYELSFNRAVDSSNEPLVANLRDTQLLYLNDVCKKRILYNLDNIHKFTDTLDEDAKVTDDQLVISIEKIMNPEWDFRD